MYDKPQLLILILSIIILNLNIRQTESQQQPNYYGNPNLNDINRDGDIYEKPKCPQIWTQFGYDLCYRFIKSPLRNYNDARKVCQAYEADLVSINSLEEHGFIVRQLNKIDPQHRKWYIGVHQSTPGYWMNEADNSQLISMENAFLPINYNNLDRDNRRDSFTYNQANPQQTIQQNQQNQQIITRDRDFLAYSFSKNLMKWGFEQMHGDELLCYICEAPAGKLHYLDEDEHRTYEYGVDIDNPELVPRGPYFIRQPKDKIFDLSTKTEYDVKLGCLAGGYPTPEYEWYREDFENDKFISKKIDPFQDDRITISGGTLIIFNPDKKKDRGWYHCKATNKFGTIISESVQLNFGFIMEFNMMRAAESGNQNWGKAIYCDPPTHYPGVKFYWAREYFPNLVEEDKRVFVSYDGALYFSALETIDRGNYSCNVQSKISVTGRNGPTFALRVNPHSNYQQLKFPNSFPKIFPEAPIVGQEVRFECIAFGYPVANYNWTRKDGVLPRGSYQMNYNRVLIIPRVQVEDQGEYVCRAFNDRSQLTHSVVLTVQAEPNFTIPLVDKHVDQKADVTWTCEAFGIPDVNYTWYRNGVELKMETLEEEDRDRYKIQDNVLTIRYLDDKRDPGMYQCKAKNQLKARYSSAQLRVLSLKPSFKKFPLESETYAAEQGNVTIKCNPEAAPKPKFVWKKDNNVIGSGGRRIILPNGNLVIRPVSRDDAGIYTCSASNVYGVGESRGRLIVLHSPRLVESLQPQIQMSVRNNLALRCQADTENLLDVAYIWKHNGIRIRDVDVYNSNNRIKMDRGFLDIENATFAEGGEYECIVKSAVGLISSKSHVIVEGPPGPPGGVQVLTVQHRSATLQWTDGSANGRPVEYYIITAKTNWNQTWHTISQNVHAREIDRYTGRKEVKLEAEFVPWSTYEFRVAAVNALGVGPASLPSPRHAIPPDRPYKAPDNIGGGGGKIGDLTITWKPLVPAEQHGPGIYYKIFWKRDHPQELEYQQLDLKSFGNTGMHVVHIPITYYYTKYLVKVQAFNEIGSGPESNPVGIYSAEDMPQVAPQQVSARSFNSTSLNVTWQPILETRERVRGKLIGHRLKYWKKDNDEQDSIYYLSRTRRPWALIVGLQPDTYYFVKVMAYNSAGEGPESERYLERTYRKPPQKPPSAVHVSPVNPSTVKVVWRYVSPSAEEEPLSGYKIRVWEADRDMSTANDTIIPTGVDLQAYIDYLSPGKTYHLRVLAFSNGGDGHMSSPALTFQMGDAAQFKSTAAVTHQTSVTLLLSSFLL
ncbi:contactin, partial [Chrysoperla carnea]|uniref:contactin n=1 Tax=Chrysoperla carnea TaxID=189513 RepID=UPI001D081DBC